MQHVYKPIKVNSLGKKSLWYVIAEICYVEMGDEFGQVTALFVDE